MESKYSFDFAERARVDFEKIAYYIAVELVNPAAASRFADALYKKIDEACTFPDSGSHVENVALPFGGTRKKLVGNYVMYYLPDEIHRKIVVLRVVYGKRDMDNILPFIEKPEE